MNVYISGGSKICVMQRKLKKRKLGRKRKYHRTYWENNKVRLCHHTMDDYIPRVVGAAKLISPDLVTRYYEKFPFELCAEPYIKRYLRANKIWENSLAYQECFEAGILAYMYSISRCVCNRIDNVEGYIRKMIPISFVWGITVYDETRAICCHNGFSRVQLDSPENARKY